MFTGRQEHLLHRVHSDYPLITIVVIVVNMVPEEKDAQFALFKIIIRKVKRKW